MMVGTDACSRHAMAHGLVSQPLMRSQPVAFCLTSEDARQVGALLPDRQTI